MHNDFEWPSPPHFETVFKPRLSTAALNPAVVVMKDGRREVGEFIRLDTGLSLLEFHPHRANSNISISFSSFKSLQLYTMVQLRPLALSLTDTGGEVYPSSIRQKCEVRYADGETFISETVGFVPQDYGLFLFVVSYGNNVLRTFIPTDAIGSYRIGDQIGQILVQENIVTSDTLSDGLKVQEQLRSQFLGQYLQEQQIVTQSQIEAALEKQNGRPALRLGDALVEEAAITAEQLDAALKMQAKDRKKQLGEILVEMEVVDAPTIRRVLAKKVGIPFVGLAKFQFDPNLIKAVPADLVRKHTMMPLYRTDSRVVVATENPFISEGLKELGFWMRVKVDPVMASLDDIKNAILQFYGAYNSHGDISDLVSTLHGNLEEEAPADAVEAVTESDNVLVRLVNKIILDALESGASDVHIESMKDNKPTRVRFRKDGALSHYSDIPVNFRNAMISRIKIMARLDISERRHSQDGKIDFQQFGPAKIELRVVTIPTTEGLEDIVMRILASPKAVSIDGLGLSPQVLKGLQKLVVRPHGLLFVSGPTGSGKTTTLHALLSYINTPDRKIWTAEDPVEITQSGLRQVQVHPKIGWNFAAVLRSFLRADPDVIMVGETRDQETGKIVLEASLTGHLVLSTMHTNSAIESVIRLLDFGLDPFNFADALLGVVGQRLARKLCLSCREPYHSSDEELDMLAQEYCYDTDFDPAHILQQWRAKYADEKGRLTLHRAQGCPACTNTGYKGRLGIHELLINSPEVKRKIHAKANVREIFSTAAAEGMRNLRQDGIEKILDGHTDWDQIKML